MSIEEMVVEGLRELAPEKQQEVLHFVESLKVAEPSVKPFRGVGGLWEHLGIEITEEDIAQARREMWGNFPRDIEL